MYDLICDVITCYISGCDTDKINAFDKIMFDNLEKIVKNMEIKVIYT